LYLFILKNSAERSADQVSSYIRYHLKTGTRIVNDASSEVCTYYRC